MRWTLRRQVGSSLPDENAAAYGEIVWSWRRDPGATLAGVFPPATGARKAASPGRVRISRKTIARGKPGCLGCSCQTRVLSSTTPCTRCCGRSRRPAFPAPSDRKRDNELHSSSENRAVRMRAHVYPRHCERSEAIHLSTRRTMDCFVASLLAMTVERHELSFSRREFTRVFNLIVPLNHRGRRESRAPTAPAVPCAKVAKESTRV